MDCLKAIFGAAPTTDKNSLFEFSDELDADLQPYDFAQLKGKVCLIANVASQ
jgi:glutathione peroxidase-family protein